jgi:hypothetical protein
MSWQNLVNTWYEVSWKYSKWFAGFTIGRQADVADALENLVWCNQTVMRILPVRGREKPSLKNQISSTSIS